MIGIRSQQQTVLTVESLDVAGIAPRLAVAGPEMLLSIHSSETTRRFDLLNVALEEPLPASCENNRLSRSLRDLIIGSHFGQLVLFPLNQTNTNLRILGIGYAQALDNYSRLPADDVDQGGCKYLRQQS